MLSFYHKFNILVKKENTSRKSEQGLKEKRLQSVVETNGNFLTAELDEKTENARRYKDTVSLLKENENISKTQRQNIIRIAYKQGYIFLTFVRFFVSFFI